MANEHKVYGCTKQGCQEAFSEFEKLKGHLKAVHDKAAWPWICGFCDQVLFYDLEFQVRSFGIDEKRFLYVREPTSEKLR